MRYPRIPSISLSRLSGGEGKTSILPPLLCSLSRLSGGEVQSLTLQTSGASLSRLSGGEELFPVRG